VQVPVNLAIGKYQVIDIMERKGFDTMEAHLPRLHLGQPQRDLIIEWFGCSVESGAFVIRSRICDTQ